MELFTKDPIINFNLPNVKTGKKILPQRLLQYGSTLGGVGFYSETFQRNRDLPPVQRSYFRNHYKTPDPKRQQNDQEISSLLRKCQEQKRIIYNLQTNLYNRSISPIREKPGIKINYRAESCFKSPLKTNRIIQDIRSGSYKSSLLKQVPAGNDSDQINRREFSHLKGAEVNLFTLTPPLRQVIRPHFH